jgi:hypothetical protein
LISIFSTDGGTVNLNIGDFPTPEGLIQLGLGLGLRLGLGLKLTPSLGLDIGDFTEMLLRRECLLVEDDNFGGLFTLPLMAPSIIAGESARIINAGLCLASTGYLCGAYFVSPALSIGRNSTL